MKKLKFIKILNSIGNALLKLMGIFAGFRDWKVMATVRYLVKDVDSSLPFYEALGFELTERWGLPFAMLKREDLTIWLSGPGSSASRPLPDGAVPSPGGWNRFVIQVEDLAETLDSLRKLGFRSRSETISGPGGTQVLVDDPSGNPIELFQAKTT